jgi:outer membrane immunogenic protein
MKRVVLAAGMLAVAAIPGLAADLPVKAPPAPPPAPVFNWSGFYIGGNAGASINNSRWNVDPTGCFLTGCGAGGVAGNAFRSDSGRFNKAAFTGGGQVGWNWQGGPNWVFGLETDINYNGTNETIAVVTPLPFAPGSTFNHAISHKLDWFGTIRARLGWLPTDRVLIYGTGGLAYGHVASDTAISFPVSGDTYAGTINDTRFGWTAGAGIEWAFANNWTAKAEYLYIDLGTTSSTDRCLTACGLAPFPTFQTDLRNREHIARFGINYLFNVGGNVGGGTAVAPY